MCGTFVAEDFSAVLELCFGRGIVFRYYSQSIASLCNNSQSMAQSAGKDFRDGAVVLDVSITHPRATTYVAGAAARQGSAAEKQDHVKGCEHNGHHQPGYSFIPASSETCGCLGKPLASYINTISEVAAGRGPAVTKGSFLPSTHRELSIA